MYVTLDGIEESSSVDEKEKDDERGCDADGATGSIQVNLHPLSTPPSVMLHPGH